MSTSSRASSSIPFIDLQAQRRRMGGRVEAAIGRVLDHGAFIMGPEVAELERQLAAYAGTRHAIGCASGTDALLLPLLAAGVRTGDAVFVPAFTFAATAEVASMVGATPVFVDVRPDDFNIDSRSLAEAVEGIASGPLRPRAVIPVDLFGQPADYEAVAEVARRHGLLVVQDAAQSFGGERHGRRAGAHGDAAGTSFYPSKPLACYGDGGAVLTDDDDMAALIRSLRVHGQGPGGAYDHVRIGIAGRLDTIQAAVLIEKLAVFPEELAARERVAGRYDEALRGLVGTPRRVEGARSAWAQYTVQLDDRDRVARELRERGVPTAIHYPRPLNLQPAYRHYPVAPGGVPVAEALALRVLSLPMHPYLEPETQDRIVAALRDALG
ncbi:MAG TPA: DegT/DnrJ/EryC1/StrS aminotransferase family protein [Geminicoccaceae bacterium]|nr:DegT/DnrJ/EryC1/StrS aminotransferase family protein [Geminicoccaceae bacterium]